MSDEKSQNSSIISKDEQRLLLDHNYDGIQELDHVLPRWWLWILYGTIVFSGLYVGYYMVGSGPNQSQELFADLKEISALKPAPTVSGGGDASMLVAAFHDPAKVQHGKTVYQAKCVACHGDKGQGGVGPNLTDKYWIHGTGNLADISQVVANGVIDKGMLAWGAVLPPDELRDVVAFVRTLSGTNPDGAKEAQGEIRESKD